jgi:NAD(P)-dependent dehydrogenase (short-subunit alcohol dehydrogenase family)
MGAGAFAGQVALVTGGASGIGRALAAALVAGGALVTVADVDIAGARRVVDELDLSSIGRAVAVALDVTDRAAFAAVASDLVDRHGRIDLLVNDAGVVLGGPTHELVGEHWDHCLAVDLAGVVNGLLATYPHMVRCGRGHIVNVASAAGLVGPPMVLPYVTAKRAVVGLSAALRPEAALHGVRVSVVCPGAVETPILDRPPDARLAPTRSAPLTARQYLRLVHQRPMPADRLAAIVLDGVARNRATIVAPRSARWLWRLDRLSPALIERCNRHSARIVQRA